MDLALKAAWTTAYVNNLDDACFAYIEPGGKKEDGKTMPRSLRHFPYRTSADSDGDAAHVRNALARIPQSKLPDEAKTKALAVINKAAKKLGIGADADKDGKTKSNGKGWVKDWMMNAKAIFDEMMEQEKLDPWYLFRTLMCGASDIDDVIDASQGSPIQIDGEALVDELIAGFVPLLKPALMRVVYDEQNGMDFDGDSSGGWLRNDQLMSLEKFRVVVKSMGDGPCVKGLTLLDHLRAVLAANEEVSQRFKTASERRTIDENGQKTGRVLSKPTRDALGDIQNSAAGVHNQVAALLGSTDTLPYKPKPTAPASTGADGSDKKDDDDADGLDSDSMMAKAQALNLRTLAASLEARAEQVAAEA
jgi:hypothetical protein